MESEEFDDLIQEVTDFDDRLVGKRRKIECQIDGA
jgi:hypothetical protein